MSTFRNKITYDCECHSSCNSKSAFLVEDGMYVQIFHHYHIGEKDETLESLGTFPSTAIDALMAVIDPKGKEYEPFDQADRKRLAEIKGY